MADRHPQSEKCHSAWAKDTMASCTHTHTHTQAHRHVTIKLENAVSYKICCPTLLARPMQIFFFTPIYSFLWMGPLLIWGAQLLSQYIAHNKRTSGQHTHTHTRIHPRARCNARAAAFVCVQLQIYALRCKQGKHFRIDSRSWSSPVLENAIKQRNCELFAAYFRADAAALHL